MTPPLVSLPMGSSALGSHQIEPFTACPKKFQYSRVRDIYPRARTLPDPLAVGLLIHAGRAQVLTDKWASDSPWTERVRAYFDEWNETDPRRMVPAHRQLALDCLAAWVDHWRSFPRAEPLAVEYAVAPRPLHPNAPPNAWRTVRYDSVERWRGRTWIGECKSTSVSPGKLMDRYALAIQPLMSVALWGPVEEKRFGKLAGVLFDIIVKPSGKKPAKALERRPMLVEDIKHALTWFPKALEWWTDASAVMKWDDEVPRQLGACVGPYGVCEYRTLCLRGGAGKQQYAFSDGRPISTWVASPERSIPPWR